MSRKDKDAIKRVISILEDKKNNAGYDALLVQQRALVHQKFEEIENTGDRIESFSDKLRITVNTNLARDLMQRCGKEYLDAINELKVERAQNNAK